MTRLFRSAKGMAILLVMAGLVGSASAFFLWSLDRMTGLRLENPWLLWLLPVGGYAVGLIYEFYGKPANGGNNLLIDEIHQPGAGVPRRMAPLILFATLATHLFGGSAGREGTAVQMGGGIAATVARILKLDAANVRVLLMAGVAAGFGSVFGTPVAGAVFALEVLVIGRMQYDALVPCFIAAVVADWVCHALGASHTPYHIAVASTSYHVDPLILGKVILASIAFGVAGALFASCSHRVSDLFVRFIPKAPLRPVVGGLIIIALVYAIGTRDYLGLGDWSNRSGAITLPAMFTSQEIPATAWLWKLIFTVITLSSGFKGGEVTPLFFIGAALGNVLAGPLGLPSDLLAAIGLIAIFAGATNTPLASTLLGVELFGAENSVYFAAACIVAYRFSGKTGIYSSQRPGVAKFQ
jgi:H+/Cl- antiporter ClcA